MIRRTSNLLKLSGGTSGQGPTCVSTPDGFFIGDSSMKLYLCYICRQRLRRKKFYPDKSRGSGIRSCCIKCQAIWNKTRNVSRRLYFRQYKKDNREKIKAQDRLRQEIRTGRMIKQPCEICGARAEAHHEDYSKPLMVRWFCHKHHLRIHRALTYN